MSEITNPHKGTRRKQRRRNMGDADFLAWMRSQCAEMPNGCLEWQGMLHRQKYGITSRIVNGVHHRSLYVHRLMWELTNGPIPEGIHVLHLCDNPPCCNPDHLLVGTAKDNIADMDAKGRRNSPRGEAVATSKLTDASVTEIREKWESGNYVLRQLAEEFGVTLQNVYYVVTRKTWRHIP